MGKVGEDDQLGAGDLPRQPPALSDGQQFVPSPPEDERRRLDLPMPCLPRFRIVGDQLPFLVDEGADHSVAPRLAHVEFPQVFRNPFGIEEILIQPVVDEHLSGGHAQDDLGEQRDVPEPATLQRSLPVGGGIDEEERPGPVRMGLREQKGDGPSQAVAHDGGFVDGEPVERAFEPPEMSLDRVVAVGRLARPSRAERVPDRDAIARLDERPLDVPPAQARIPQPVKKDDVRTGAGLADKD